MRPICKFTRDWGLSVLYSTTFPVEPVLGEYPGPIEDFHEIKLCPVTDNDGIRHHKTQISLFSLSSLFHYFFFYPSLAEPTHAYLNDDDIILYVFYLGKRSKKEPVQCVDSYEHGLIAKAYICTLIEIICHIIIYLVLFATTVNFPNWNEWDCGWRLSIPFLVLKGLLILHCIWLAFHLPLSRLLYHVDVFYILHYHYLNDICLCSALTPLAFRGSICLFKIDYVRHKIFGFCYCSLHYRASMALTSVVISIGLIARFIDICYDKSQFNNLNCVVVVKMSCWICLDYLYMMMCHFSLFADDIMTVYFNLITYVIEYVISSYKVFMHNLVYSAMIIYLTTLEITLGIAIRVCGYTTDSVIPVSLMGT